MRSTQPSFLDADYLCDQLIPRDSFYRKFRDHVWPLIKDKHFEEMYCGENGRPPISPRLLAMATILQFHRNLSDREMERACMYDIEIKFALGLKLDERPFDHSSLGDFRERLLRNSEEHRVFERILKHLVKEGLIGERETQRIDATHVIADIAVPTVISLIKKGVFEILKHLAKTNPKKEAQMRKKIHSEEYTKEEVNHACDGRLDIEKRQAKLVWIVEDARTVLRLIAPLESSDEVLKEHAELLRRILRENTSKGPGGETQERPHGKLVPDMLVSPIDPDARFGAKSVSKRFMGYKASITEAVKSRFITNIQAMPGNRTDGEATVSMVKAQKKLGLIPKRLIGDSAYGRGEGRRALQEHGTKVVAPLYEKNPATLAVYPKSMFKFDPKKNEVTCPEGVKTSSKWYDARRDTDVYHFPMSSCSVCPRKPECTNAKENRRTIGITTFHFELLKAERFNRTKKYKKLIKLRQPIEGKISELKRYHGLTRARYRGLRKLGLQCFFSAAAVNIKRWMKLVSEQMDPKPVMA